MKDSRKTFKNIKKNMESDQIQIKISKNLN
jgi:hypothetical protein